MYVNFYLDPILIGVVYLNSFRRLEDQEQKYLNNNRKWNFFKRDRESLRQDPEFNVGGDF